MSSISLPNLRTIDSDLNVIFNNNLQELTMPSLESIGQGAVFQNNPQLPEAVIDELLDGVDITGEVRRENNGG